jgi:hypothetical protein
LKKCRVQRSRKPRECKCGGTGTVQYVGVVKLQERRRGVGQKRIMFIFMVVDDRDKTR